MSGFNHQLPTGFEWEKSARGVDGRWYVWGDAFDPSYCHTTDSHKGRRLPTVVNSYPIDESVYGVRGLAGNMMDLTSSLYRASWDENELRSHRVLRGGCWGYVARYSRISNRTKSSPSYSNLNLGFRIFRK